MESVTSRVLKNTRIWYYSAITNFCIIATDK